MNEMWIDIPSYEGLYQVSNLGRIKSLGNNKSKKEKILKQCKNGRGYYMVTLSKNNIQKNIMVHLIVAKAFIDNPDNLPQVNHKDENKENNCVSNLEFCTRKYNVNYGTRNERTSKALSKKVFQYDLEGNFIKEWENAYEAKRILKINQPSICMCCKGKRKTADGYIWRYADEQRR